MPRCFDALCLLNTTLRFILNMLLVPRPFDSAQGDIRGILLYILSRASQRLANALASMPSPSLALRLGYNSEKVRVNRCDKTLLPHYISVKPKR